MTIKPPERGGCAGFCRACGGLHRLAPGNAASEARRLQTLLEECGTLDLYRSVEEKDPGLSTDLLFGPQRGKMFGVLECLSTTGQPLFLYGFSGQYNGRWIVPGWAPPLFDVDRFKALHDPVESRIKELGEQITSPADLVEMQRLRLSRRELSRRLMEDIHGLYRLQNFRGRIATLAEVVGPAASLPTGIGDCCAPKLLNQAAVLGLRPVSMAEFYFGRSTPSGSRNHGVFYEPCQDKCRPLLGFLLCGASSSRP